MTIRVGAYVDGFNLYNGIRAVTRRADLWLDLESMPGRFLSSQGTQRLVAVHYFTTLVTGAGQPHQQAYLDALATNGQVTHVHLGRFQRTSQRCRSCGTSWTSHEEKESDVALSVQAVEDVARGAVDQVWYVSGDSDLCPSVRAVRRIDATVRTLAVFPPRRSSVDLEHSVHGVVRIFDKEPSRRQLPDTVIAPNGRNIVRPTHWR